MTAATLAAGCVALAVLCGSARSGGASSRVRAVLPPPGPGVRRARSLGDPSPDARRWVSRAAVVVVAGLLLSGRAEVAVPLALAVAVLVVPGRRRAAQRAEVAAQRARDLPRAADLLATCLEAGAAPADAVQTVCDVVGGPVRSALLPIAGALRAGVDPAAAWAVTGPEPNQAGGDGGRDDPVQRLGRALGRAAATGSPLAETISGVAADERERARWAAEAAVRRAGVRAVGPLALCFLPAFVLLGVVPVVVGVAGEVLGGLR